MLGKKKKVKKDKAVKPEPVVDEVPVLDEEPVVNETVDGPGVTEDSEPTDGPGELGETKPETDLMEEVDAAKGSPLEPVLDPEPEKATREVPHEFDPPLCRFCGCGQGKPLETHPTHGKITICDDCNRKLLET